MQGYRFGGRESSSKATKRPRWVRDTLKHSRRQVCHRATHHTRRHVQIPVAMSHRSHLADPTSSHPIEVRA